MVTPDEPKETWMEKQRRLQGEKERQRQRQKEKYTEKIKKFPVYLVGKEYWKGMLDWIKDTVLQQGNIKPGHLDLFTLTDDPDEIANGIETYYSQTKIIENF